MQIASAEMRDLLAKAGSMDERVALAAQREIAKAAEGPIRQVILIGSLALQIFQMKDYTSGAPIEVPTDLITPGQEKDYVAYTIPNQGAIPTRSVEGDYVQIPVYDVGNAIDISLKIVKNSDWGMLQRAIQIMEAGVIKKQNDDAFRTLIAAAADRGICVFDSDATAGLFTKRLVKLMNSVMRRNGGGNSASLKRFKLTDLYMSPECKDDTFSWGIDQIDETTRRLIFVSPDGSLSQIGDVRLHDIDELGEGQEYQLFYLNELSGQVGASDTEVLIGLDLRDRFPFMMPVRENWEMYEDPSFFRSRRVGFFGWASWGFAALDNRPIILGSC